MTTTAGIHHHPHHHLHLDWESALDALATACVVGALLFALALATGMFPERWSDPSTVHVSTRAPIRFPAPPAIPTATAAAPPTTSVTRPVAVAPPPVTAAPAPAPAFTTSCRDALAYLAANQAPGYVDTCAPGSALGHYGYACANVPGRCSGVRIVHIACPAPFV